jgi:membrane protein
VIGFMTWMWLSSIVILEGIELNAVMEHHTACDTAQSPRASKGVRGTRMADAVGREND